MPGPGGRGGFGRPTQKPKNVKKTIKRLLSYMGEYKGLLVLVFFCIIFSSGSMILGTSLLKPILNDYIIPLIGQEHPDLSNFVTLLIIMVCVYLFGSLVMYANNRIMSSQKRLA